MVDDKTDALLQDAAFGEGPPDADALVTVLAENAEARQRLAQYEALAEALRDEGSVGAPAGLTETAMKAVSDARSRHDGRADRQGDSMNKKWILGIAATVAAALGIYIAAGGAIPPRATEGTVGAAKRYQGQQLTTADVQLGDQGLQTFLQTATFDQLRRDPSLRRSFVKVVTSPAFARLASDASFKQLANDSAFVALITDADLRHLASDAALKRLANDASFRQLANDAALKQLVNDAAFRQLLVDADFMRLVQDAEFVRFMQDANLRHLLSDASLRQLANDAEFAQLLTNGRKAGSGQQEYIP